VTGGPLAFGIRLLRDEQRRIAGDALELFERGFRAQIVGRPPALESRDVARQVRFRGLNEVHLVAGRWLLVTGWWLVTRRTAGSCQKPATSNQLTVYFAAAGNAGNLSTSR
jgi:hypothetical protein